MKLKLLALATLPIFCFAASDDININYDNGITSKTIKESKLPKNNIRNKNTSEIATHILKKQDKHNNTKITKKDTSKKSVNKVSKFRNKAYVDEVSKVTHWQDYQVRKWLKKHPKEHLYNQKQYNFSKKDIQKLKELDTKYSYQ